MCEYALADDGTDRKIKVRSRKLGKEEGREVLPKSLREAGKEAVEKLGDKGAGLSRDSQPYREEVTEISGEKNRRQKNEGHFMIKGEGIGRLHTL